jgi:nitrite reductase (NADH) large subunit
MTKSKLVVIGNGMAGARFVEELISRGGRDLYDIAIFGDEPYGNYNRILLSSVLGGGHQAEDIFINPLSWYVENEINFHAGVRATAIDPRRKAVTGAGGVVEHYDTLVIATGSSALVPPIAGLKRQSGTFKGGVFVFRTLDDCNAILNCAAAVKKAAVIGGGLLGLEAARGLLEHGLEVHVVHLMPYLMELQLDAMGGAILQRSLEKMGLHIHLKKNTRELLGEERVSGLKFEDGGTLSCDLLVISAGIRPNVQLAREAGLLVERAIVVGDDLRSDDPDIYALGECAQHRGRTYGLVAPLWEQAQVLADRLSCRRPQARYQGSKIATKLKVMGIDLSVMGSREVSNPADEEISFVDTSRHSSRGHQLRTPTASGLRPGPGRAEKPRRAPLSGFTGAGHLQHSRDAGRGADLQLQRGVQRRNRAGGAERMPDSEASLRQHPRRYRLRLLQEPSPGSPRRDGRRSRCR